MTNQHICPICNEPHRSNNIPKGPCERCKRLQAIGQALLNPIRHALDYEGLARSIFRTEIIPPNELAIYKDESEDQPEE